MADLPIKFEEHLQLGSVGVPEAAVIFPHCKLEAENYICVREASDNGVQVAIIDLKDNNNVNRKTMSADSAIMNPKENILALRAGRTIQVVNLDSRQRLKNAVLDSDIAFWRWVSPSVLGIITNDHIYHWDIHGNAQSPERLTTRHQSLQHCQIINYQMDPDGKWTVLNGIAQENGRVVGRMQLFSRDRNVSQPIEGHAATFGRIRLEGAPEDTSVFAFVNKTLDATNMHIVEIDHKANNPPFGKRQVELFTPPETTNDFPVLCIASSHYGIVYVVTKLGFIHLHDLETGTAIYMNRISADTIFTGCSFENKGVLLINRKGQVLSVEVNDQTIVPYALNQLGNTAIALALASRAGLPGADQLYSKQFESLLSQGQYGEAARVAASSPRGILRTPATIQRLQKVQAPPGEVSPILQYFGVLLDKTTLNKYESIQLATPVIQQDRKPLLEKWLRENKLETSEELGDLLRPHDTTLALAVYLRANVPLKVVAGFAELGEFDKIPAYCEKTGYSPDWTLLIQQVVRQNPDRGAEFAQRLVSSPQTADKLDLDKIVDIFMGQNLIQQVTAFLLDALKDNQPSQAHLQSRLLELNLMNAPQVADAILGNQLFSHYDRARTAALCEKSGLLQRALENYDDLKDIKRCIVQTDKLNPEWIVSYLSHLTVEQTLAVLKEMLKSNLKQNLQVVTQAAIQYHELLGSTKLISMFEEFKTAEGIYYFLQSIVNLTEEPAVVFKYIQSAASIGQFSEIQRIVQTNNAYNPEKVKNFLKDAKLPDQLPLITVCDRFDFIHELVLYLYQNQQFEFIQVYVTQVNPRNTPQVIAGLLDVDCDEDKIKALLESVVGQVPIEPLAAEVEKRNRLKLLLPFLEKTIGGGSKETVVYDTMAKIAIDSNNNAEKFLKENDLYNTVVVGKYCATRDPSLACIAYEKGQNDDELIKLTNENSMHKKQARYLVKRADLDLWAKVLSEDSIHRRQLIDQVVGIAIPESPSAEDVSVAVKAFMQADLPSELIELLEKIVLEPSQFNDNENLQNLLILTAINAQKSKVSYLIDRLDKYDVDEIAKICKDHGLYEEAFEIYDKHEQPLNALEVLTDHTMSLDRGFDYAEKHDQPELWSAVAKAQLNGLRVSDALKSYIKAGDPSNFSETIEIATRSGKEDELVPYLKMARKSLREPEVDGKLLVCYASLGQLEDLQQLLEGNNVADIESVGDILYEQENWEASRRLYSSISNWAKLASTLVYSGDYQGAVDAARKASSVKVWKQVNQACLEKKEFKLAQICGLNLIVHAEEMRGLVDQYESLGYIDELISLLEQGLGLERAHKGMFTELAIIYAKYYPTRLMEHLNLFWSRLNIPKVIRACENSHLWPELVFLYCHDDEYDNASLTMIEHSADAFDHSSFKEVIVKVVNLEIYYRAINFYMQEQPQLISDLLTVLTARIDVSRVVKMFQTSDNLPMIKPFLISVQNQNLSTINNAYHDLLIEEKDYKSLRDSVDHFDKYDPIGLAQRLEKDELIFFRQIAAHLYTKNKKWNKAISLSKEDKLWKDAIVTAAASGKSQIAEDLLRYFVDIGNKECYVATLYACYELIRPDVVDELNWRHKLSDYTMPYSINQKRVHTTTIEDLKSQIETLKANGPQQQEEDGPTPLMIGYNY